MFARLVYLVVMGVEDRLGRGGGGGASDGGGWEGDACAKVQWKDDGFTTMN